MINQSCSTEIGCAPCGRPAAAVPPTAGGATGGQSIRSASPILRIALAKDAAWRALSARRNCARRLNAPPKDQELDDLGRKCGTDHRASRSQATDDNSHLYKRNQRPALGEPVWQSPARTDRSSPCSETASTDQTGADKIVTRHPRLHFSIVGNYLLAARNLSGRLSVRIEKHNFCVTCRSDLQFETRLAGRIQQLKHGVL